MFLSRNVGYVVAAAKTSSCIVTTYLILNAHSARFKQMTDTFPYSEIPFAEVIFYTIFLSQRFSNAYFITVTGIDLNCSNKWYIVILTNGM